MVNGKPEIRALHIVREALWTGIPVTSVLLFVAVAIKVFRAAHMETSTAVAIVKSADVVALSKGVVVTLLPGFLASLIALAVWLWVRAMPSEKKSSNQNEEESSYQSEEEFSNQREKEFSKQDASQALIGPNADLLWVVLAIGFFTVPFVVFLLIFLPVAVLALILMVRLRKPSLWQSVFKHTRTSMVVLSLLTAVASTGWLAISSDVWLPLRTITISDSHSITVGDKVIEHRVAAYILDSDADQTTLLVDEPRAVVTVSTASIEPNPPICIPAPSHLRWLLVRTSQKVGLEDDYPSPYPRCPTAS